MLKETPLSHLHAALGASFLPFGGWRMPLRYQSEIAEHEAVRQGVGLFDLSHMGEFLVRGPEAGPFLQKMLTNDLSRLSPGRAQYNFLLNPDGGVIDDLIVYLLEPDLYLLVVNAANTDKDWQWLSEHAAPAVELQNISEDTVLLALSGPQSTAVLSRLTSAPIDALPYYACLKATVAGIPNVLVATTGYTGEWTYELFVRAERGAELWQALLEAGASEGIRPAGLAARNTLRLEMGYLLCGTDMDESTTPLEANAAWAVKLQKGDFIGREALLRQKETGLTRRLTGLLAEASRAIPRNGLPLTDAHGNLLGRITSGSFSPTLKTGIALGFLPPNLPEGHTVYMEARGQRYALRLTKPPFIKDTSLTRRLASKPNP